MNAEMPSVTTVRSWWQMIIIRCGQRDVSPDYDLRASKQLVNVCRVTAQPVCLRRRLRRRVLRPGPGCSGN